MEPIRQTIDDFLDASGMAPSSFGRQSVNNKNLVKRLRRGGDVKTRTSDRIRDFIEQFWRDNPDHPNNPNREAA